MKSDLDVATITLSTYWVVDNNLNNYFDSPPWIETGVKNLERLSIAAQQLLQCMLGGFAIRTFTHICTLVSFLASKSI